ncbi:hypothetical protein DK880_00913 [Candidatus Cardinium hertigii]|uniref:Uncharacterized protein n=1 Tax=Candidatus Cardinium hertigii TaxID=247481 RepID=A0A2Z3LA46_9BACT|nr:hypothetical protein DK880_00913 [Candidatus Cardinium hertigii]
MDIVPVSEKNLVAFFANFYFMVILFKGLCLLFVQIVVVRSS